ncbi:MAG: M55 family metallopeptidase [Deltaproteobacteria bacterium]|jgi:D-amino peptidase|nr:M55 family metallopeptidase [Deltaproteobacteria bacterium]
MHVAVFADLEGSFGIWRMRQCHTGTAEWQYGRHCLTADVNAVIQGAFDGGAQKVTVKDTHDSGFNCIIKNLDKRAAYMGGHYIRPTLFGRVTDYDLILYVAIHAASGTPDAFFPHTHLGIFSELKLNGKAACEMEIYGGYLGEFGVPIGFVSGEDIAVRQALTALPWAKSVMVDKRKEMYVSGKSAERYLAEGRENLIKTAAQAVESAAEMKPLIFEGPLHFEGTFRTEKLARRFNTWDFKRSGATVEWQAQNMIEGFDKLNKLTFFPKKYYAVRGAMLFLLGNFKRLKHTYFAPKPNPEGAYFKI